ncbi:MAG TPA: carbon-nitrogen hydrolase family protein [Actinocatenispora sp.]
MPTLTLALLQLDRPEPDLAAAVAAGEAACRRAAAMGADLALFPEMWSNGYTAARTDRTVYAQPAAAPPAGRPDPADVWRGEPVTADSAYVRHFAGLAAELDMAIAVTYLEDWRPAPRNTVSVLDRHGRLVHTYAKVHTCAFALPEAALTPGDSFGTCVLDTAAGDVAVGTMICYDREFPESARALMLGGAEVILTPNACDMEINRLSQFRARAFENMTAVAMANYAGSGWGTRSRSTGARSARTAPAT